MVHVAQFVLSLLPLSLWGRPETQVVIPEVGDQHGDYETLSPDVTKSIAIIGAGSGGLAALKNILELPEETRAGWEVILFEQRRDVGGIWLPDPPGYYPSPPEVPETPLYPSLRVNSPHPTMTYPGYPFPPGTPLFPLWDVHERYHVHITEELGLAPYIRLNHTVVSTQWHGHDGGGDWHVEVHAHHGDPDGEVVIKRTFDHLVVANGHWHYPYSPTWNGAEGWLANTPRGRPQREIIHSVYYREAARYANQSVVIVGAMASGSDIALQVGKVARVAYQSVKPNKSTTPGANVIPKPTISYFTNDSIIFDDGSELTDIDAVILATGYVIRVPFLTAPHASTLVTDPLTTANSTTARTLTNNLHYIFPLWRQIFSLAPDFPTNALAFLGLPVLTASCPSDNAQGLLIAHALVNASILPSRDEMLQELVAREDSLRAQGFDPYLVGHRLLGGDTEAQDYQDGLVDYLKKHGVIPDDGKPYVEQWRRWTRQNGMLLARAWRRVAELGEESRWLDGVKSEDDWADMMTRLAKWQIDWEEEHEQTGVLDFHAE